MFEHILRTLVYLQGFIWVILIARDFEIKNLFIRCLFPTLLGIVFLVLDITGFSFSQYTNDLLKFYSIMLLITYIILRSKYGFIDSVCLSFLAVFINSYYWESILHFNAIIIYGLSFNQFVQAFHLLPAYFLIQNLEFNDIIEVKKLLIVGLMISCLNLLSLNFIPPYVFGIGRGIYRPYINKLTRISCLSILVYILMNHTEIIKKGRR